MGVKKGKQKLNVAKFKADKVTIVGLGDIHWGSKYCDTDLVKEHIDWIGERDNTYMIGMGDMIECATRDSVGAGVYEQDEIVDEQLDSIVNTIKPLADAGKIIGNHTGNHEWRVYKGIGVDLAKIVCDKLNITYLGWSVHHLIRVNNQSYIFYSAHGSTGARLPHTKIKAAIDRANISDAEVYLIGHTHQLAHHTRTFYRVNKSKRMVEEGEKHFVLTGSYLNHWGGYAEMSGYEMMRKGSPKIKLSGLEHRIKISL